jgi:hypothetical protein
MIVRFPAGTAKLQQQDIFPPTFRGGLFPGKKS